MPHFNPRSPCGERPKPLIHNEGIGTFQSTLPVRGATRRPLYKAAEWYKFQSTLPVRGATALPEWVQEKIKFQSTLPVRGATSMGRLSLEDYKFQSTLPVRGATPPPGTMERPPLDFNPRSPCGERRQRGRQKAEV